MIIYSSITGPRLQYAADFIGQLLSTQPFIITNDVETYKKISGIRLNYSNERILTEEYWIQPAGLLAQKGIRDQEISVFQHFGIPAFFRTGGDHPFDIFSSVFYLLSRYEEYLAHKKDSFGRYAHENSLAFRQGFLSEPLVNQWIIQFRGALNERFPGNSELKDPGSSSFQFIPTYDIDEAWSFKFKSPLVSAGGMFRDLLRGKWSRVKERSGVRRGKRKDPFDSYEWMDQLHRKYKLEPRYFFLVAQKRSRYDRNIPPTEPAFGELVRRHASQYSIGIHPSWQSGDTGLLKKEISLLEKISGVTVISSRQHFIRFTLPETCRELLNAGIREDFSMGYGSVNGFRASVATAFYWYDLEKDEQTDLLLYPFCFMDANSFFEARQSPEQALKEMNLYYEKVRAVNGTFISIWHNTFLGTDPLFSGWREAYEKFLAGCS